MVNIKKWDPKWVDKVKLIVKKTEKKKDKDGNDTTVDISSIGKLIEERKPIADEVAKLNKYITDNTVSDVEATHAYKAKKYIEKCKSRWETFRTTNITDGGALNGEQFQTMSDQFRNGGANNYDWNNKINTQFSNNLDGTGATGAASTYKDNLYQLDIGGTNYEIVEEELVNLIARVCYGLKDVDLTEFQNKFNAWETNATRQGNLTTALTALKTEGASVVKGNRIYDFGYTYTKHDASTALSGVDMPTIINHFYNWVDLVKGKKTVGGVEKTLAETLTKDNTHSEMISIYGKGDAWKANTLKDDFGIVINEVNQTLYKSNKNSITNFNVSGGIGGWIKLGEAIHDAANGNKNKLSGSFNPRGNNSPQQALFTDLRTNICNCAGACANNSHWNEKHKTFGGGTHVWCLDQIERSIDEAELVADSLEIKSRKEIQKVLNKEEKVDEKKVELSTKQTELTAKETEIQTLITEELTNIRTELKKVGIESGKIFAIDFPDGGTDNRKTIADLIAIKEQLEDVRFLEKDDIELDSTVLEENTAYNLVKTLWDDYTKSKVSMWGNLKGTTNAEKCENIRSNPISALQDLQPYLTDFEKWEKLIKFTDDQKNIISDIKIAMGKKDDPKDTLKVYQDKLKALDALLDDTVITQAVIDDWKAQKDNFKNSTAMEAEIKKVVKNGKLDEDFKKVMIKEDADITDLANLFKKKKAKDIITMIRKWEYDKETDADKKARKVKVIKMNMDKKAKDADPTEEEITTGLYKLAVGEYSQKSEDEIIAWEKDETNGNPNEETKKWYNPMDYPLYWGIGVVLTLIGVGVLGWYMGWWFGNKEEAVEEDKENEKEDI